MVQVNNVLGKVSPAGTLIQRDKEQVGHTDRLAQLSIATITGSSYIYSEVQGATLIASQTLAQVTRTFTGDD